MIKLPLSIGIVITAVTLVYAQGPGERQQRREGPPPRGFAGPPGFNLMTALDTNKDGKISAQEIDNATATLKKLDKDKDGKLSAEEIGWPPSFGGGFPGPGGGRQSKGGPRRRRFFSAEQLRQLDRNKDGKISKEEIPQRMQELILTRLDANKDGLIDKEELSKIAKPQGKKKAEKK